MSLTRADIEHIARLSRLALREEDVPRTVASLSAILEFVGQLERAPTEGVEPMSHPLAGLVQRLREDEVTETDRHDLYQQNAPQVDGQLYLVPKVLE